MSKSNLAAVVYAPGDLRVEEFPIPEIGDEDLLIKPYCTGICGSDMHKVCGSKKMDQPLVIGHEASGTVAEVGNKVTGFEVGDRVAMEPPISCWNCEFCKTGRCNLCTFLKNLSSAPTDGTMRRLMKHPARCCWKLPDSMSYEDGALLEPLSVAIQGCQNANLKFGQNVLILGAGPIGVMCLQVAKAAGAIRVVITDIDDERLKQNKVFGPDLTINVKGMDANKVAERVSEFLGTEPDVVLDCVEVEDSIQHAIKCVKPGGSIAVLGLATEKMEVEMNDIIRKGIYFAGAICYDARCYPIALNLVTSGKVNFDKITRTHYPLEKANEAFKRAEQKDVIKVFVRTAEERVENGCNGNSHQQ